MPGRITDDPAGAVRAVCFDLDGTLVETEFLKALSYAHTVAGLRPAVPVDAVLAAYADLAGQPREEIAAALVARFAVAVPEERFLALRVARYEVALADHALVRAQAYLPTIALLRDVRARGYRTGVATMSTADQAGAVLAVLGIADAFDAVVTRDEVTAPKPDPEIYRLLAARLGVSPSECVTIEDSLPGIRSALAAGMHCVAAATALTRSTVHASGVLPPNRIVDDPADLAAMVNAILAVRGGGLQRQEVRESDE